MRIFVTICRRQTDLGQQPPDPLQYLVRIVRQIESTDRLGNDIPDFPARIEAGIGVLEDHLQATADRRHFLAGAASDIHALELDGTAARPMQADDQFRHRGLAAAGFSDKAEGLARFDSEINAIYGLQDLLRCPFEDPVQPWS